MEVKVLMFWLYVTLINVTKFVKTEHFQEWEDFKLQYGKHYATPEEDQRRMNIFKENLRKIATHNKKFKKGKLSFKIGVNSLSDITAEEFSDMYVPNITFRNHIEDMTRFLKNESFQTEFPPDTSTVPESKNWVTEGAVTPVKNQKSCGGCWAFAAAGVIESHNFIRTGKLVSLSEQNLIDCVSLFYGCKGGNGVIALGYVMQNQGIDTEESYPFTKKKGRCRYTAENKGATIRGVKSIESRNEDELKSIVGLIGPVTASIAIGPNFQHYNRDSGIYHSQKCGTKTGHAVIVVGYGTEGNTHYWLVRNSWGTHWGLGGYFKIRRGTNECQITSINSYPVI